MTSDWRDSWVIFAPAHGDEGDKAWTILANEGCETKEFIINSTNRELLRAMGLDTTKAHIFHGPYYVGGAEKLDALIYELQRIAGEIVYEHTSYAAA